MIHYDLRCENDHGFDGWFASSDAFERQREAGLLECPACGSSAVDRALMAPALSRSRAAPEPQGDGAATASGPDGPRQTGGSAAVALPDPTRDDLRRAMRALREAVETHGINVGRAFPEEARRIHYGEAEPRGIYGQADVEEARELIEEGIEILPLPVLPEDRN